MSKKILVNGITLEGANIVPLLLKIKEWESFGHSVTVLGSALLQEEVLQAGILQNPAFILSRSPGKRGNKFQYIFESLKRNLFALRHLSKLKGKFDVVYTISPVLDFIFIPYFLKKIDKGVRWVTVFDNTVPLILDGRFVAGNKFIRILAWLFYQISLVLLKKADAIFVIKPELKKNLEEKGFSSGKLIITGNGVEKEFIEKAQVIEGLTIDALFIGRLNEAKGIYDLLRVLERIKERHPSFQLALMGRGDASTEKRFREKVKEMNLEKNVNFLGYKMGQEKFDIIKTSKIFLFLSETESVPIAPLEAVCSGLKTLVYDLDAYSMYRSNEVLIFKKNDYGGVAAKVLELFDNQDFKNEQGRNLLQKYSWSAIAQKEIGVMEKLT